MSQGLFYAWFCLCAVSLGAPALYYLYMRHLASKPWNLEISQNYRPTLSILVPTYNEGRTIKLKLKNLMALNYPQDLTEIIFVDSCSTDGTVGEIKRFISQHPERNLHILEEEERSGKSPALNLALGHSSGDVIVVSDADCFWPPDILNVALPYLADPKVGAIAGQEILLNPSQSWVTKTEAAYRASMFQVQLGESKFYSTVQFEGGFGAYKRKMLGEFDCQTGSDDSGTAFDMIQRQARTIVISEATFFTWFPTNWRGKITMKRRRAHQLVQIWMKSLRLFLQRRLVLPKTIALPNIFLFIVNPVIFLSLILATVVLLFHYPILLPLFAMPLLLPKIRIYSIEIIQNNFIALLAVLSVLTNRRSVKWCKSDNSRKLVNIGVLKDKNLM